MSSRDADNSGLSPTASPSKNLNDSNTTLTPWPADLAAHYRRCGYWRDEPLTQILQRQAAAQPQRIAIIDGDQSLDYQTLLLRCQQLAAGFSSLGIGMADNVVVQLPNQREFIEVLFALMMIGAVPVLALPSHRTAELSHFIRHSRAKTFIGTVSEQVTDDHAAMTVGGFNTLSELAPLLNCVIAADNTRAYDNDEISGNKPLLVEQESQLYRLSQLYHQAQAQPVIVNPDAIALMQLSGGTTNVPKLIPRTHNDYYYSIRESVTLGGLSRDSRYLAVLPAAHNFTLSSPGLLGTLEAGGTIVMSRISDARHALQLIAQHQVSHCALVPPLAIAWQQHAANHPHYAFDSLKVLQVGGAKLSAATAEKLKRQFKCQIQQVFGMAEGLVNYTRIDDNDDIVFSTQGKPLSPDDEIRIVDDNDEPVANGQPGHLLTRGPYTVRGYYRADAHNALAFTRDGFYRTGDIVSLTADGYIVVEGRHKDQINRGGEKISAAEVEEYLLSHPDIIDAAVVAMHDEYLGERSCAYLITRNHQRIALIAIRRFLREKSLAEYKFPDRVEIIQKFPKTHFGKVSKKALRQKINTVLQASAIDAQRC
ncbi:MAG TPA: AMP-binding protein [Marinagarivorans sp.]